MEIVAKVYRRAAFVGSEAVKVSVVEVTYSAVLRFQAAELEHEQCFSLHSLNKAERDGLVVGSMSCAGDVLEISGDVCREVFDHFLLRQQITASRRDAKHVEPCVKRRGSRQVRVPEGKATQQRGCAVA